MQKINIQLSLILIGLLLSSCDFVKRSSQYAFNRYKIKSTNMSPALKIGDSFPIVSVDTYRINDIVAFHPPQKYAMADEKILYIERLVALPGDEIQMTEGNISINNKPYPFALPLKHKYYVQTSMPLNEKRMEGFEYAPASGDTYEFLATEDEIKLIKKNGAVVDIKSGILKKDDYQEFGLLLLGPNQDNWGPLTVPKKGDHILITEQNQKIYESLFMEYEKKNDFAPGATYTVENNYYFVLGDSRHNALDSRYLGFIPASNIAGVMIAD